MQFNLSKKKLFVAGALCSFALFLCACNDGPSVPVIPPDVYDFLENMDDAEIDVSTHTIVLPEGVDSFTVDNVAALGGSSCYLALDDDSVDPEIDWDNEVSTGTTLGVGEDGLNLVVLDGGNRVVAVWHVRLAKKKSSSSTKKSSSSEKAASSSSEGEESSSSKKEASSSSAEPSSSQEEPSSSEEAVSSSSEPAESSSSKEEPSSSSAEESSSSVEESSSSVEQSSSSETPASSANVAVKLSDLSVERGTVTVKDEAVYVELPYGSDLSNVELLPLDTLNDLRRPVDMEFEDDEGVVGAYSVVAGVQLPGSDFSARNDFWATTSDAMATMGKATVALITNYRITSDANLESSGSTVELSTKKVTCAWGIEGAVVPGGWKMAGGYYYTGDYSGSTAFNIYDKDYTGGTPSTGCSKIALDMSFGKPFTARPVAFEIKYSYHHETNTSSGYPQKSLVYVMLVGKNGKVVATGAFSDEESTDLVTRKVKLSYGKDPFGLLTDGYPVAEGLSLGTGDEDVVAIHVMFASSAYAHNVCGGTAGNEDKYRGAENAALVLDNFKLIY